MGGEWTELAPVVSSSLSLVLDGTQVTEGRREHTPEYCELTELITLSTKQDDQSLHTTRRAKINATGFGPWRLS